VTTEEAEIRSILEEWARATREGRLGDVLANHSVDAVIFDVLPPFQYRSKADYQASWDDWQPNVEGDSIFELDQLEIVSSSTVAFAFGKLECGGTLPDGKTFRDTVRATFCLSKTSGKWFVSHQHISKPIGG